MKTIDIITDPLCSWCYAAAPLIKLARQDFVLRLHQGGLLTGSRQTYMSASMREYILGHCMRIQKLTGQQFAPAYVDGILNDHNFFMSSILPSCAINASVALGTDGVDMLDAIQTGYYIHGKSPSDFNNMREYALAVGHSEHEFDNAYKQATETIEQQISDSRKLLKTVGSAGFPTFILNRDDGSQLLLEHQKYYADTDNWCAYIKSKL